MYKQADFVVGPEVKESQACHDGDENDLGSKNDVGQPYTMQ